MKFIIKVVSCLLFLVGCSTMEDVYLDDNYSDRVELAQQILGRDSVYFDTSNYIRIENTGSDVPITEIKRSKKLVGGEIYALVEQFETIGVRFGKIAISGNISEQVVDIILTALNKVDDDKINGVKILYIGDPKYQSEIEKAVEAKGGIFVFSKMPNTKV